MSCLTHTDTHFLVIFIKSLRYWGLAIGKCVQDVNSYLTGRSWIDFGLIMYWSHSSVLGTKSVCWKKKTTVCVLLYPYTRTRFCSSFFLFILFLFCFLLLSTTLLLPLKPMMYFFRAWFIPVSSQRPGSPVTVARVLCISPKLINLSSLQTE